MSESRTLYTAGLIMLLTVTLWTFWSCLGNPFQFDDNLFLQSPQVTDPGDPWYLLRPTQTRQLTYLTFYWNYRLGGAAPGGYHLVNLLLHLTNLLACYWWVRQLLQYKPETFSSFERRWVPLMATGIFALHPVQAEAVNYVYQRSSLLAALFSLLCMGCFLCAKRSQDSRIWYLGSFISFLLAVASKESALILPLIWVAFVGAESPDFAAFRSSLPRLRWMGVSLILAAAGGAWFLNNLHARGERTAGLALMDSSLRYLLAQIQVLATYFRLLLVPTGLSIDHDFHPSPAASLYGLLCLFLLAGILAMAALLRRKNFVLSFLILAFLLFLAPSSSILPSQDLLFEHRLYLPMIAGAILMAVAMCAAIRRLAKSEHRRVTALLACAFFVLGGYSVSSKQRTYVWGDGIRLWEDAAAKAPDKPRVHYNLGIACLERDPRRARQELLKTVELDSKHASALYNLGWLAQTEKSYDTARFYYRKAIQADSKIWQAQHNLGNLDVLQGRFKEAKPEFEEAIRLNRNYWPAYLNLAAVQLQTGDTRAALQTVESLKRLRWDLLEARYLSAYALILESRFGEADSELKFIVEHDRAGIYHDRIVGLRNRIPSGDRNR